MTSLETSGLTCERVGSETKLTPPGIDNAASLTDGQFWSLKTHPPFLELIKRAGYSKEQQTKTFDRENRFEPIGRFAGTVEDPFNAIQPASLISSLLQRDPRVNDKLWQHFSDDFVVASEEARAVVAGMAPNEHMSSNTVSFDLVGDPLPKVYWYPIAIAISKNESRGELVTASLEALDLNLTSALNVIRAYVNEAKARHGLGFLNLECLSFDAVDPAQSRFKLYVRTPRTSFATTQETLTLGGRLSSEGIRKCLANIRSFWSIVLQTDDDDDDDELPQSDHRTAVIIFNFEIRHNDPTPRPKAYIPTRHYGGNDLKIAKRLSQFFRTIGLSDLADSYVEDAQSVL